MHRVNGLTQASFAEQGTNTLLSASSTPAECNSCFCVVYSSFINTRKSEPLEMVYADASASDKSLELASSIGVAPSAEHHSPANDECKSAANATK